jgi:GNAT superfamily N-acetyltransferase
VVLQAPPRTDLSDAGLTEAIEADQLASRITDAEIPVESHLDADVAWGIAPIADIFRNVVLGARFAEVEADRRVAEVFAGYHAADRGFGWWISPRDRPVDLGARLEQAGMTLEGTAPAMAANLADVPLDEPPPAGLRIEPVTDAAGYADFLTIVEADWLEWTGGVPTPIQQETLDFVRREIPRQFPDEPVPLRWVGRVDGRPVATSRGARGGGAAGLYAILTQPAHRGHGFGRAMTIAALRAAAGIGSRIGVLQSSDLGYSVYQRLGFRQLFSYDIYVHPGSAG